MESVCVPEATTPAKALLSLLSCTGCWVASVPFSQWALPGCQVLGA